MVCWIVTILCILYMTLDANYFFNVLFTIGFGRLFDKKKKLNEATTIYGICTPSDVDIFWRHMNNARYVRKLDFARFHFYDRTGIYKNIMEAKGHALQGATTIRYRRTIPIFSPYKVETRLVYWDDKAIYIEQQFKTIGDDFVRAVVLSKQNIVGIEVDQIFKGLEGFSTKPTCPPEITHWLEAVEISSAKLRKKD